MAPTPNAYREASIAKKPGYSTAVGAEKMYTCIVQDKNIRIFLQNRAKYRHFSEF
jgi:hypothetical protein